jgi:hypothetical protein
MHGRVTVVALSEVLVAEVAANMRASDAAEVGAVSWPGETTPAALAAAAVQRSRYGAVVLDAAGRPAVAMGAIECWPGTFNVWLFATDAWASCWRAAVRWLRRHLPAGMQASGAGCAFVFAAEGRPEVARMLGALGFKRRGVVPRFGRGGEPFALWSVTGSAG